METINKKIELLFKRISESNENTWHMDINQWDWNPGVSLYGVIKTYKNTEREKYRDYLKKWFDENENWRVFGSVNNVMPANVPLFLLEDEMDYKYYDVVKEYVDWCLNKAYRTNNGGYAHIWKKGDPDYINQLWIDTVFMSAIFLSRYGAMFKHTQSIVEALKQLSIHLECQLDKESNLCYHAYHCKKTNRWVNFGAGEMVGWLLAL
jgi:unsaturated rhamnogalacturonyl hydrolase